MPDKMELFPATKLSIIFLYVRHFRQFFSPNFPPISRMLQKILPTILYRENLQFLSYDLGNWRKVWNTSPWYNISKML